MLSTLGELGSSLFREFPEMLLALAYKLERFVCD
jgi:hypothetical protein